MHLSKQKKTDRPSLVLECDQRTRTPREIHVWKKNREGGAICHNTQAGILFARKAETGSVERLRWLLMQVILAQKKRILSVPTLLRPHGM